MLIFAIKYKSKESLEPLTEVNGIGFFVIVCKYQGRNSQKFPISHFENISPSVRIH